MKCHFLFCLTLFFTVITLYGQQNTTPLEFKSDFWRGFYVQQGNDKLSLKEAEKLMSNTPETKKLMQKARANHTGAALISFASGALIGVSVGLEFSPDLEANWFFAGAGLALFTATIPLQKGTKRNLKNAVTKYNESIGVSKTRNFSPDTHLVFSTNGLGFQLTF
ncbi:hypothetical protein [Planktosalinus lacus]|uniref:Uncharacterized protein n=1 Tax=Planktosalinus lacus TaxID=1526573 RepID=A0A8J2V8P4_9FLAO|nr:hypothetical protein [Planktosalinus lacus]GGD85696.1 hypothetical protein GCM10011312_07180 [Planktosalinus lacus]